MGNNFNLDNYETVEQRLMRFKHEYPNYRMTSELIDFTGQPGATRWVMKVDLYKDADDMFPVATGHAFEIDGAGMTQRAAALETCETSALGRALANAGFVGNRRTTREEMEKVQRWEQGLAYYRNEISKAGSVDALTELFNELNKYGYYKELKDELTTRKQVLLDKA